MPALLTDGHGLTSRLHAAGTKDRFRSWERRIPLGCGRPARRWAEGPPYGKTGGTPPVSSRHTPLLGSLSHRGRQPVGESFASPLCPDFHG